MRSRRFSYLIAPIVLLAATFSPSAQAVVQNRISGAVGGARTPLPGTVVNRVQRATDLGAAPADRKLESMSLRFSLTPAQQADLTQLLANQLNPSSASYHQWLTPEQYGARFGLSSADVAKVSAWLTSQGFTITRTARSSTYISFSGTVAQAEQAFGASIHSLSLNGEPHISNVTEPTLPAAIAGVVTSIVGLNDFKAKPHSRARNAPGINSSKPLYTQTANGVTSHYISPADFYTIYDENPLLTAGTPINGTGVTIAVMGNTDLNSGNILPDPDVAQFRTAAGLPAINLVLQSAIPAGDSDAGVSQDDIDEAHLDVEWSGAAAPGAKILFVYSSGNIFADSLTYAIDNKVAPIITISYGLCESGWGTAMLSSYNSLLAQANAQGQTVISSSGDAGATDCDVDGLASEGLNVDFPSSSPYVTSAGGTMFSGDVNTPATYWNTSNATTGGSAIQYIPEQPWNETTTTAGLGYDDGTGGGAGGGGASAFFSKPAWQTGSGVPSDSSRDVPDIALNAAALHDGYLVCSSGDGEGETPCTNGFLSSDGSPNVFGGTSFVAPAFAGILALVQQQVNPTGAATGWFGNVGPTLYGFLNGPTYSSVFHDIISGNNSVPCTQGTPNCPNGGAIGFNAGTGYDQASGLGSFDVNALVTGWSGVKPVGTGTGSGIGTGVSTTSLTTSTSICAVSAGTLALSVAVTGTASGPTPTGSVQFFVDNSLVTGSTTALSATGTASYSLVTSSLSSGGHSISAVYSGDGNYVGSKGTLLGPNINSELYPNGSIASVDIVSSSKPDFSFAPATCGATTTVAPGATATGVSFTITPVNGFTGSVNLTFTNNDGMAATPTFSVSPVSISTSSGVTTSFVVVASEPTTSANSVKPELRRSGRRAGKMPWYAAGSGATLACLCLLTLPRRRRWSALLALVITISALTAVGCGGSSSNSGGSGGGTPAGTTNASAGTYTFTVTAISGTLVHSSQISYVVP
jgi:subtilase family serine protease